MMLLLMFDALSRERVAHRACVRYISISSLFIIIVILFYFLTALARTAGAAAGAPPARGDGRGGGGERPLRAHGRRPAAPLLRDARRPRHLRHIPRRPLHVPRRRAEGLPRGGAPLPLRSPPPSRRHVPPPPLAQLAEAEARRHLAAPRLPLPLRRTHGALLARGTSARRHAPHEQQARARRAVRPGGLRARRRARLRPALGRGGALPLLSRAPARVADGVGHVALLYLAAHLLAHHAQWARLLHTRRDPLATIPHHHHPARRHPRRLPRLRRRRDRARARACGAAHDLARFDHHRLRLGTARQAERQCGPDGVRSGHARVLGPGGGGAALRRGAAHALRRAGCQRDGPRPGRRGQGERRANRARTRRRRARRARARQRQARRRGRCLLEPGRRRARLLRGGGAD
ncbi:hypothetical protein T492DRAFT_13167 [Pavlovales sp. CCMP2436]|nr:hypothetical protein T492DRAFT_13167 [Pavlovales sp. CCMP2436]